GNHRRAHGSGRLAGAPFEQAGAPAPGHHEPERHHEPEEVEDLANVVIRAELVNGVVHQVLRVTVGEFAGAAQAQVILVVSGQRTDNRSGSQLAFHNQLNIWLAVKTFANTLAYQWVLDIVQAPDVKCRMRPAALSDEFDDIAHPGTSFHQDHIADFHFLPNPIEVAQGEVQWRPHP